jgi:hypothetical protein
MAAQTIGLFDPLGSSSVFTPRINRVLRLTNGERVELI